MSANPAGLAIPMPEQRQVALSLEGVTKRYGQAIALNNVSFSIGRGEVVALLGPSGAGKSTIFRCISRLAELDAGQVIVEGRDVGTLDRRGLREHRRAIGLIFQQFNLIPRFNSLANTLGGRLGHAPTWRVILRKFSQEDQQLAMSALDRVGLLEKSYQRADSLSGGQQQRVAIARVLTQQSRIILADEPVASLDPASAANVLEVLRGIARERGIAVLCSLHQTDLAMHYSDRIVAMRKGRVVLDTATSNVSEQELEQLYHDDNEDAPATRP